MFVGTKYEIEYRITENFLSKDYIFVVERPHILPMRLYKYMDKGSFCDTQYESIINSDSSERIAEYMGLKDCSEIDKGDFEQIKSSVGYNLRSSEVFTLAESIEAIKNEKFEGHGALIQDVSDTGAIEVVKWLINDEDGDEVNWASTKADAEEIKEDMQRSYKDRVFAVKKES